MLFSQNRERRARIPQRLALAVLALAFCSAAVLPAPLLAQRAEKSGRKVVVSSRPEYPEVLRRAQVGGVCRLKATVLPNGSVSRVEILGGNPILAESGVAAVKRWKYAPAPSETVEDVTLTFNPN